jgi:hypothetical protein
LTFRSERIRGRRCRGRKVNSRLVTVIAVDVTSIATVVVTDVTDISCVMNGHGNNKRRRIGRRGRRDYRSRWRR